MQFPKLSLAFATLFVYCLAGNAIFAVAEYMCGVARKDVTGPAAEINMMGYASFTQNTCGIHTRLKARAFYIKHTASAYEMVHVVADLCMITQAMQFRVLELLASQHGPTRFTAENVILSATHTHSGPGGYFQYVVYQITALGFIEDNFEMICAQIAAAIDEAINNPQTCEICFHEDTLEGITQSRSPEAYLENPAAERALYPTDISVDIHVITFKVGGILIGVLANFPMHATNLFADNCLISGDNMGYAALLCERAYNPGSLDGEGPIVVGIAQGSAGDVAPIYHAEQLEGALMNAEDLCDKIQAMVADCCTTPPTAPATIITGPIKCCHQYFDIAHATLASGPFAGETTCLPAFGAAFAQSNINGPPWFDIQEGDLELTAFWTLVRDIALGAPSNELETCQANKPILMPLGELDWPYAWAAEIVPLQVCKVGTLVVANVPVEISTMAGRRLQAALSDVVDPGCVVKINSYANAYASYVTTREEYLLQHYEGAATLYGQHTLDALIEQMVYITEECIVDGNTLPSVPAPPNLIHAQLTLKPGVVYDKKPRGTSWGENLNDHEIQGATYNPGDTVTAHFQCAHPRNNLRTDGSFCRVEQEQLDGSWVTVANDCALETFFKWWRTNFWKGWSECECIWEIPDDQPSGTYRIVNEGARKKIVWVFWHQIIEFSGMTPEFQVN